MAEGPDGKIYVGSAFTNAGGVESADYLARWNPVTEAWEAVVSGINAAVRCLAFDANGDLYAGGDFTELGSVSGNRIVKISNLDGMPTISSLGPSFGLDDTCHSIAINSNGDVYAGGVFEHVGYLTVGGIAKWDGSAWSALAAGLNGSVHTLAFAPNGDLYIGGLFADASYPNLCKWNGTAFSFGYRDWETDRKSVV